MMTQEDKELLLKELCERLPYNVMVQPAGSAVAHKVIGYDKGLVRVDIDVRYNLENIKLYLRSMSSMTEEESAELSNIINEWFDKELFYLTEEPFLEYALSRINYSISPLLFDWLNAHHFDYRGLIKKGLAIEVTVENNPYK